MTAPVLRTPSEVAAFLAERVMRWEPSTSASTAGSPRFSAHRNGVAVWSGEQDPVAWTPWYQVEDAIDALEGWASNGRRRCDRLFQIRGWTQDTPIAALAEHGISFASEDGATIAQAACRALASALGATVEIDDA